MPIYEYECRNPKCGHQFEMMQKMSDNPIRTCPVCKARKVSKLISASSFVLKGGGWYQTEIANKEKAAKTAHAAKLKGAPEGTGSETAKADAPAPADAVATPAAATPAPVSEAKPKKLKKAV